MDEYSRAASTVWNAGHTFFKAWTEISIFGLGGIGEAGPAIATKFWNLLARTQY